MGFGGAGGGFSVGPSAIQSSASAGLPFAGVPGDLVNRVDDVLAGEPEHPDPLVDFSHNHWDRRPFNLRTFLRPYAGGLFLAVILVVLETALQHVGPLLIQVGIDRGVLEKDTGVLFTVAFIFVASVVLAAAATTVRTAFTGRIGERLVYELRIRVFSHFQRQSLSFFTAERSGVLMTRMTSDIEALTVLFQEGIVQFVVQGMTLLVVTIYLAILNPQLAIVSLAVVVPANLLITLWFRRVSATGYLRVRDRIADILADLSESLDGIRLITAFNRRRHNIVRHRNIVGAHLDANLQTGRAQSLYGPGTEALGIISQAIVLLIGGRMVLRTELSIGEMTAFLLFLTSFFAPIQTLVQLFNQYQQGNAAVIKLRGVLGTEPSVTEKSEANQLPLVEGHLKLESVTFSYQPGQPVLHQASLEVKPGEILAVVGPTGAGKSTIAKLVSRFYDPDSGVVRLDGHDLRDVTLSSLRKQVGVVPQEPFLFNGSIRDNVAFASPGATKDEIQDACIGVGLDRLLERLPAGIDSPVHERGASLSAGERQLLALARVFLTKPRMLVLDEATSNLDLLSEATIERALDTVLEGRTAIIVAHRLSTVLRADRIAVIDDGQVKEFGTHNHLLNLQGQYASMHQTWITQMQGETQS